MRREDRDTELHAAATKKDLCDIFGTVYRYPEDYCRAPAMLVLTLEKMFAGRRRAVWSAKRPPKPTLIPELGSEEP